MGSCTLTSVLRDLDCICATYSLVKRKLSAQQLCDDKYQVLLLLSVSLLKRRPTNNGWAAIDYPVREIDSWKRKRLGDVAG